jgi:hypothetical protein
MEFGKQELAAQLRKIHPEIDRYGLDLDLEFKNHKHAWVIKFEKGDVKLHTYLEKEDADACLKGIQCVYLGVQLGQFVDNFKILEKQGK